VPELNHFKLNLRIQIMKNLSTGTGLALLSAAILGSTIIMRSGPADQAAHAAPPMEAAKAIAAASTAQVTPTIVWYGITQTQGVFVPNNNTYWVQPYTVLARAWSDGRIEVRKVCGGASCGDPINQGTGWTVVSDPNSGYNAAADINFDSKVDGADLSQVLNDWGDAPRQDIPPSTCPLNLINP
jgi:hypothetical protein